MVYGVRPEAPIHVLFGLTAGLSIITYVLLCGYSPFRSDDTNELIRETTAARVEFHERYWSNISSEGTWFTWISLPNGSLFASHHVAKDFIRALLDPAPDKRPTAEEALKHKVCFPRC